MDNFQEDFKSYSQHLHEDIVSNVVQSFHQYKDALRPYKGKNKIAVLGQSLFTRNNLADTAFSLKEVCETLMGALLNIAKDQPMHSNQVGIISEVTSKMEESLSRLMKGFEKNIIEKMHAPISNNASTNNIKEGDSHVIIVENNEEASENVYTNEKWNEVVSKNISKKLKGIPVNKTSVNKEGKGCVFFPSKDAQEKAKQALKEDFKVVVSSKSKRSVLPKLKIYNIDIEDKDHLKACILEKNPEIEELLKNIDSKFEIILIDSTRKHAIVKVTPDVRTAILSKGRVYVGMQGLFVKDHFYPLQCYACQKFGHKQGSHDCEKANGARTCFYCGKDHLSKDCDVKRNPDCHNCVNCASSQNPSYKNNANHTATSLKCPMMIKETNALIRRTVGLETEQSNLFLS